MLPSRRQLLMHLQLQLTTKGHLQGLICAVPEAGARAFSKPRSLHWHPLSHRCGETRAPISSQQRSHDTDIILFQLRAMQLQAPAERHGKRPEAI